MRINFGLALLVGLIGCERAGRPGEPADRQTRIEIQPPIATPDVASAGGAPNGCGGQLQGPAPDDLYDALVHGDDEEQGSAAFEVLKHPDRQAGSVVRRAIAVVARNPYCPQLHPLTKTLEDESMDESTRAAAALALGAIARDFPCTFPSGSCPAPHDPIPNWSLRALEDCLSRAPAAVQRACAEALGYVGTANLILLTSLRDEEDADTIARIFAGRAVTRLTGIPSVSPQSLDRMVEEAALVKP